MAPPNPTNGSRRRPAGAALLFLLPAPIGFVVFYLWPTLRGIYLSFTDYDGCNRAAEWIGLDNYQNVRATWFWQVAPGHRSSTS